MFTIIIRKLLYKCLITTRFPFALILTDVYYLLRSATVGVLTVRHNKRLCKKPITEGYDKIKYVFL